PQLQEQTSAKHLCTHKAQEHCENQGMIVKQRKPAEDHAWPKGTHGSDEGREHDESETAIEEEPRGACQDGEQMPHAIPPGLQVRLAIALITAQRNGYFHNLGASPQRVDEQL